MPAVDQGALHFGARTWQDWDYYEIQGLRETDVEWWLGYVSVSKTEAFFRFGYGAWMKPVAHFRKERFEFPDLGRYGVAAIFHQFVSDQGPSEYFAGWVPLEREAELDQWIAFMNDQIRQRLIEAGKIEP